MSRPPSAEANENLAADFLDFIACLNEREVAFVLVGGYALAVYGVVRATGDIDFLYERNETNVQRLCAALEDFGAPKPLIDFETLIKPESVTYLGTPPLRIDLLSDISGVSFQEVWASAGSVELQGERLRVIGLAELRANKAATGRKKDRDDLRKLPDPDERIATRKTSASRGRKKRRPRD